MLQNLLTSASPNNPSPTKNFNFLIDKNSVGNQFCTLKLSVSKCPNYGRGRGGQGTLDNVQSFVVFFLLMASLRILYKVCVKLELQFEQNDNLVPII